MFYVGGYWRDSLRVARMMLGGFGYGVLGLGIGVCRIGSSYEYSVAPMFYGPRDSLALNPYQTNGLPLREEYRSHTHSLVARVLAAITYLIPSSPKCILYGG